jgi:arginase family enzyme
MLLDHGVVAPGDVALFGARSLDPPEVEYLAEMGIDDSVERAAADVDAVYIALDLDVLDPTEADMFMPEPSGPSVEEIDVVLRETSDRTKIAGIGVTGFLLADRNIAVISRLLAAAGL